ncbi:hypothetical protein DASC09_013000 [Saccharomycopsis crataegensis]|uniref:K Homology domain-containing protein n=1 Tax=Saccharomycopsis crataegensis TaxID=43959 RepID=A0AAV5QHN3_9ASCO|nr:hypothetical protein DASC09_013000 [Saccharomycopsis crataegensis]
MDRYNQFTYYRSDANVPIIHSDFGKNPSINLKSTSSHKNKILSDVTNKYGRHNTTTKLNSKPKIETTVIKSRTGESHSQKFSTILSLKAVSFAKPNVSECELYYQTTNTDFWKKNDKGMLALSNVQLMKNFLKKQTKLRESMSILTSDSYNENLNVKVSAPSLESLIDIQNKLFSLVKQYNYRKLLINSSFFNDHLLDLKTSKLNSGFIKTLDSISKFFNVEIFLSDSKSLFNGQSLDSNNNFYLYVVGTESDVSAAELRCKLLIDDLKNLKIDSIDVDLSLINLIGGNKLENFRNVIKQTGIFIYMPELFSISPVPSDTSSNNYVDNNKIFLSGIESQILNAKYLLKNLKSRVENNLFFKDLRINKTRMNYMLLNEATSINKIMYNNGSFIQFPDLSSSSDLIRIQANNEYFVEKTLKEIAELQNKIYELEINIECSVIDQKKISSVFTEICFVTNTWILMNYEKSCYKIVGNNSNVKRALQMFSNLKDSLSNPPVALNGVDELDFNNNLSTLTNEVNSTGNNVGAQFEYKFKIELLNGEKEFICGKKNGKLIKIKNQTSTKIEFKSANEYNFMIEISGDSIKNLEMGINLLELEFPSEMSFCIPEIYHRQIIGIGGNLIQSIMRKYNVFIKFSNTFELKQESISFKRFNNVLIKCPNKNSINIPKVKLELENLVKNCQELNFINFRLSENQHRMFLNNFNCSIINEIEKKTNSFINFPSDFPTNSKGDGFYELIELKAIDTKSAIDAFKLMSKHIANEQKLIISSPVSNSFNLSKIASQSNEEFLNKIIIPFKIFLNVGIKLLNDNEIILTYMDVEDNLKVATEALRKFLKGYDLKITDTKDIELTYHLIETKKIASNSGFSNSMSKKKHMHTQSLNIHYNAIPSYKQTFMRSPPTYSSSSSAAMQFSPIDCDIKKFTFPLNQTPVQTPQAQKQNMTLPSVKHQYYQPQSPPSPVEMKFPNYPIIELNEKMQHNSGMLNCNLLPAYDINNKGNNSSRKHTRSYRK